MGLVNDDQHFKIKLQKLANGGITVTKESAKAFHLTSMAIKSGCRYVDELSKIDKSNILDAYLDIEDPDEYIKKKEQSVKATFKIEINQEEKLARDSTTTNVYHTGLLHQGVILSEEDKNELEIDRLKLIEEQGVE